MGTFGIISPAYLRSIGDGGSDGGSTSRAPYALSSITDIPAGAHDGDAGLLGGAAYVLRDVTLPGGGTRSVWVDAADADADITVLAYADGDEDAATLATQGWTVTTTVSTPGTVTTDGTDVILATTAPSSSAALITTATLTPTSRVRVRGEIRCTTASAGDSTILAIGDGTPQVNLYQVTSTTPANRLQAVTASATSLYPSNAYRDGSISLPAIASAPALIEMRDDGATVGCSVRYDGATYMQTTRLTAGSVPNFVDGATIRTASGAAGNGQETRVRDVLVYTVT